MKGFDMADMARLAAAYASLLARDVKPTVRSLKSEAGCDTNAAAAFLRDVKATTPDVPPVPTEVLAQAAAPLWATAFAAAQSAARAEFADRADAATAAEAEALEAHAAAERQIADMERQLAAMKEKCAYQARQVLDAEKALDEQRAELDGRIDVLEKERATAREGLAKAEGVIEALQNIIHFLPKGDK